LRDKDLSISPDDFVQILIVRRDEEFDSYCRDFGKDYVVIGMPELMSLETILAATKSTQFKDQQVGDKVVVKAHSGVGYSRLFAQIFARLMELPTVWMLDDNVQACYDIDIQQIFQGPQDGPLSLPAPKSCKFANIIYSISAQFGRKIGKFVQKGESDKQTSVPVHSNHGSEQLEHLIRTWKEQGKGESLQPCPKTQQGRQTPRCKPTPNEQKKWTSQDLGNFSGASKEFAVVGMSRDPAGFVRYKNMKHPFKVTHSVYSFYLLNVELTVDRGVFYPPKTFWEDIHFNQLCEEKDMAVLKCRHFFHHKKNLQSRNPRDPKIVESFSIAINVVGQKFASFDVSADKSSCTDVWPQVLDEIKVHCHDCAVVRAHGIARDGSRTNLSLDIDGNVLEADSSAGSTFETYEVDVLYPVVDGVCADKAGLGVICHKQILRGWMASNNIRYVFTWPDPLLDDTGIGSDWKLLEAKANDDEEDGVKKEVFNSTTALEKVGSDKSLTIICDSCTVDTDSHLSTPEIAKVDFTLLKRRVSSVFKKTKESDGCKIERVHFILPAQLDAFYSLTKFFNTQLFEDYTTTVFCSGSISANPAPPAPLPSEIRVDDSTFKLYVLELRTGCVVESAKTLPNAGGKESPQQEGAVEEVVSIKKAAPSSQKSLGSIKKSKRNSAAYPWEAGAIFTYNKNSGNGGTAQEMTGIALEERPKIEEVVAGKDASVVYNGVLEFRWGDNDYKSQKPQEKGSAQNQWLNKINGGKKTIWVVLKPGAKKIRFDILQRENKNNQVPHSIFQVSCCIVVSQSPY